ncbi:MAG: hotdog fold thioesterase [Betaproteobacteria bacterium]|nr:hotdog fold thioesterase [Betaproteobacteria bacterium]
MRHFAERDPFVAMVGVEYVSAGLGFATVRMQVHAHHLNFMGTCHGAAIFTLADTAFGLASNSHGPIAAGIDAHMTYHLPVKIGEILTATATEVSRSRKLAVYRIDVKREDGALTSVFTGTVYISSRQNQLPAS